MLRSLKLLRQNVAKLEAPTTSQSERKVWTDKPQGSRLLIVYRWFVLLWPTELELHASTVPLGRSLAWLSKLPLRRFIFVLVDEAGLKTLAAAASWSRRSRRLLRFLRQAAPTPARTHKALELATGSCSSRHRSSPAWLVKPTIPVDSAMKLTSARRRPTETANPTPGGARPPTGSDAWMWDTWRMLRSGTNRWTSVVFISIGTSVGPHA